MTGFLLAVRIAPWWKFCGLSPDENGPDGAVLENGEVFSTMPMRIERP
jgi:hypothetical protein